MKRIVLCWLLLLAAVSPMAAQVVAGQGGISGTVTDSTGASVPGATVVITNELRGIRRELTTNEAGVFTAPALTPASGYAVTVNAGGFAQFEVREISVAVGQNVNLPVELTVASGATTIVVTSEPIVDDTRTEVSQVVSQAQIDNLPINGRRVDSFVLLTPATVSDGTFGLISFRGNPGGNTFLTDGNDTTNQYYGENAGRTRILSQISQDAVQEFQVLNTGYSAEYGRATGGVINTVTRGGGNEVHGTGFWFFRNRSLNARDRYAAFNPPEYRHQGGASIGGPIVKNKLFYFGNFEVSRRNFPIASSLIRAGVVDNQQFTGCTVSAAQCAAIQPLLAPFFSSIERSQEQELAFAKIDWRPNERHSFSTSFNYLRFISPNGIQSGAAITNGNALTSNGLSTVRNRYGRFNYTLVATPTLVNDFRFGWFKDRQADELGGYQPVFGNLSLSVGGANLGIANYLPRLNPSEQRFQFADTLTWTVGRHILRFGADISDTEDYINNLVNRFGTYSYGNVNAFATDFSGGGSGRNYQSFTQSFGNPISNFHVRDYAFFMQDQWRVTNQLTLNLGVRYDYADLPTPGVSNPDYPQTGRIPEDRNNIAPRVGVAYRFDRTRTVLRAGYGIFYGRYTGGLINNLLTNNNVITRQVTINNNPASPNLAGPVFPNRLASSNLPGGTTSILFGAEGMRTPYTQNGDVAIEQAITEDTSITVSYIFSRGLKFFALRDLNVGALGPSVTYQIEDLNGQNQGSISTPTYLSANRIDPRYLRVSQVENGGRTYYDGLAVQVNRRFARGFLATLSYTWSHAIDTNLGGGGDNVFFSATSFPITFTPGDYRGVRGTSDLDQRHRAVFSFVAQPRLSPGNDFVSRTLLNTFPPRFR
jgi:outer membrane receptor protein involved in Fe transport